MFSARKTTIYSKEFLKQMKNALELARIIRDERSKEKIRKYANTCQQILKKSIRDVFEMDEKDHLDNLSQAFGNLARAAARQGASVSSLQLIAQDIINDLTEFGMMTGFRSVARKTRNFEGLVDRTHRSIRGTYVPAPEETREFGKLTPYQKELYTRFITAKRPLRMWVEYKNGGVGKIEYNPYGKRIEATDSYGSPLKVGHTTMELIDVLGTVNKEIPKPYRSLRSTKIIKAALTADDLINKAGVLPTSRSEDLLKNLDNSIRDFRDKEWVRYKYAAQGVMNALARGLLWGGQDMYIRRKMDAKDMAELLVDMIKDGVRTQAMAIEYLKGWFENNNIKSLARHKMWI